MSRSNMLTCVGLVTYTSEATSPEGSLVQADNVNVDEANVITPRRGFDDFLNPLSIDDTLRTKQLLQYKSKVIRHFEDKLEYENQGSFVPFSGSYLELAENLRIKYKGSNGNLYFTSKDGIYKISARNSNEFTSNSGYIIPAGAIKAYDLSGKAIPSLGGFLPPQSKVAYRCLFGYKDVNNNLLLGSPSSRIVVGNVAQDIKISEVSEINVTSNTVVDSNYILFSTKTTNYFIWFDNSGSAKQPNNGETIGKIGIKVVTQGFTTAATIAGEIANAVDSAVDSVTVTLTGSTVYIVEKEANQSANIALGVGFASSMTVTTSVEGNIITADNANVELEAIIPSGVSTNYFFQVYRTAVITASVGVDFEDLEPGDECQLVYETPVTQLDLNRGYMIALDQTPETFRASATNLYTNPQTGETILAANEPPPVSADLELFKGSMFYGNTKSYHRLETNLLSVDDFVSGVTQFYVGDSSGVDSYTFNGQTEKFELTVAEKSRTVGGSSVEFNSASNLDKYYLWFDKGSFSLFFNSTSDVNAGTDEITITAHGLETNDKVTASGTLPPELTAGTEYYVIRVNANVIQLSLTENGPAINISTAVGIGELFHSSQNPSILNKIGIRVDLDIYPDTVTGTKDAIIDSMALITDFSVTYSVNPNAVIIETTANGNVDDAILSAYSPGPLWNIAITQQGDGESVRGSFSTISITNPAIITATNHGLNNGEEVELKAEDSVIDGIYTITYIDKDNFSVAFDNSSGVSSAGVYRETSNDVLLSSLSSVSQAIDETARSLVRQINLNPESNIIADYISGANDLPGKIFLRRKDYSSDPFYIAVNSELIGAEWNPEIPTLKQADTVTFSSGINSPAKITTSSPHNLLTGDKVYISSDSTTPAFAGEYSVTVLNSTEFTVPVNITTEDTPTSSCVFWNSSIVSDNLSTPNRLYFSKEGQPESVPIINYVDIGSKDGAIQRILSLRDNLFILKDDGIFMLSGGPSPNFSVRLVDSNTILTAPDTAVVLNNKIYCLTDQGIVAINESGPDILSIPIENKIKQVTRQGYDFKSISFGISYENDRAYVIWLPSQMTDTVATQCYRYHIFQKAWTRWTVPATCGLVEQTRQKIFLGAGDRNFILEERKLLDRTDYADRSFARNIAPGSYSNLQMTLSSVVGVSVGDVVYQEQTVTVSLLNRLLRKLDFDSGLSDNDYESSLKISVGGNITTTLNALNAKLVLDAGANIDNSRIFSTDFSILKTQFNDLIDELNLPSTPTSFKNYKPIIDNTPYEAIIEEVNKTTNRISINLPVAFVDGPVTIYKGISCQVQWSPLHYGDPMALKQVSTATCIFDQNNFYSAIMGYSSDVSQSFVEIPFKGKGSGYWGYDTWGDLNVTWGGEGNDAPFRDIVPVDKQRCRYQNVRFKHINARDYWRILGITASVRAYSDRAYKGIRG